MASDLPEVALFEFLTSLRNASLSQISPTAFSAANPESDADPDQDSPERSDPHDRILLVDPATQRVTIIEGSAWGVIALLNELMSKDGPSPASKSSIEAMPEVGTEEGDECVICLEEFVSGLAKQMPCEHKFHSECVEKWLKYNGSCPVCRYKMPVDDDHERSYKNFFGGENGGRREIWVSFALTNNGGRRSRGINRTATNQSDDSQNSHSELQGLE